MSVTIRCKICGQLETVKGVELSGRTLLHDGKRVGELTGHEICEPCGEKAEAEDIEAIRESERAASEAEAEAQKASAESEAMAEMQAVKAEADEAEAAAKAALGAVVDDLTI